MATTPKGKFSSAGADELVRINGSSKPGRYKLADMARLKEDPAMYTPPEPAETSTGVKR